MYHCLIITFSLQLTLVMEQTAPESLLEEIIQSVAWVLRLVHKSQVRI